MSEHRPSFGGSLTPEDRAALAHVRDLMRRDLDGVTIEGHPELRGSEITYNEWRRMVEVEGNTGTDYSDLEVYAIEALLVTFCADALLAWRDVTARKN
jgi:hypothetical protein